MGRRCTSPKLSSQRNARKTCFVASFAGHATALPRSSRQTLYAASTDVRSEVPYVVAAMTCGCAPVASGRISGRIKAGAVVDGAASFDVAGLVFAVASSLAVGYGKM